jgi:hypothetical protein
VKNVTKIFIPFRLPNSAMEFIWFEFPTKIKCWVMWNGSNNNWI